MEKQGEARFEKQWETRVKKQGEARVENQGEARVEKQWETRVFPPRRVQQEVGGHCHLYGLGLGLRKVNNPKNTYYCLKKLQTGFG